MLRTPINRRLLGLALAFLAASTAHAQRTYVGQRSIGTGFVNLSITTDGTLGVLAKANVLDWNIFLSNAGSTFTLFGPALPSTGNTAFQIQGTALSATATDLLFNFSLGSRGLVLFQNAFNQEFWCLETPLLGCGGLSEGLLASSDRAEITNSVRTGTHVLASVTTTVPEPASVALLAAGLLAIGCAVTRRRRGT